MKYIGRLLLVLPSMLLGMSLTAGLARLEPSQLGKTSASFHFMLAGIWA